MTQTDLMVESHAKAATMAAMVDPGRDAHRECDQATSCCRWRQERESLLPKPISH